MQFHQAQLSGINGGKAKLVSYLLNHNLLDQDGVLSDIFNDTLDPLPAAELKVNHTARYPGLYGPVFLFQYQQITLGISAKGKQNEEKEKQQFFHP
jgi:hypothetical protein